MILATTATASAEAFQIFKDWRQERTKSARMANNNRSDEAIAYRRATVRKASGPTPAATVTTTVLTETKPSEARIGD